VKFCTVSYFAKQNIACYVQSSQKKVESGQNCTQTSILQQKKFITCLTCNKLYLSSIVKYKFVIFIFISSNDHIITAICLDKWSKKKIVDIMILELFHNDCE
jgi:hypothetical protein